MGVAGILLEGGAIVPRYLMQRAHHLALLQFKPQPHCTDPILKSEVSALLTEHGRALYGPNLDPSTSPDDFDSFQHSMQEYANSEPSAEKVHKQSLTTLVHTYNFNLDPRSNDDINTFPRHDNYEIYRRLSLAMARQKVFAFTILNDITPPGMSPNAIRIHLDSQTTAFALRYLRPARLPPQQQTAHMEWFQSRNILIDADTIYHYTLELFLYDPSYYFNLHIPFLRAHTTDEIIIHGLIKRLITKPTEISPTIYTTLCAEFPTFDQDFAQITATHRPFHGLTTTLFAVPPLLDAFGPTHTVTNYILDVLFCNNNHNVPQTAKEYDAGFRMKPAYMSWVVARNNWCSAKTSNHRIENTANNVLMPVLQQISDTIKTSTDLSYLQEWRAHIGKAVEAVERRMERWKIEGGGEHLKGWPDEELFKQNVEGSTRHLGDFEQWLVQMVNDVDERMGEVERGL
ncbi:hypothetical protein HDV00_004309 [Rhizophlyctis rosea]|nr:hypothetical protein HDV00_004309 [Rhizophlyctis rosea]